MADSFSVISYKIWSTLKSNYYKGEIADVFALINYKIESALNLTSTKMIGHLAGKEASGSARPLT